MWKKLKGWKEKTLSQAGREVLIKVVVEAIPSYIMGCFRILIFICAKIESLTTKVFGVEICKRRKSFGSVGRNFQDPKSKEEQDSE